MFLSIPGWLKRSQMVLPKVICQFKKGFLVLSHFNFSAKGQYRVRHKQGREDGGKGVF